MAQPDPNAAPAVIPAAPIATLLPPEAADHNEAQCKDGLILKAWRPFENLSTFETWGRGIVYFIAMSYLFLGISIVSDHFMSAIEVITSSERKVTIKKPGGFREVIMVRVWNETVANLTLMALGSSAPEILLAIIEMFQKNFEAGELGPGTVVGSAAYNLFIIIAYCMIVIPKNQVRRIFHLRVFIVTAIYATLAYIWMYLIVSVITPGRVEVWEGLVTLILFPITVYHAYSAEQYKLCYSCLRKDMRVSTASNLDVNMQTGYYIQPKTSLKELAETEEVQIYEQTRRDYITTLKELRQKHPQADLDTINAMALEKMMQKIPKSRAFHYIQGMRMMTGGGSVMHKAPERAQIDYREVKRDFKRSHYEHDNDDDESEERIYFEPGHYTVMESVGDMEVCILRRGDLSNFTTVEIYTEDGSANAGSDYISRKEILKFPPGVDEQRLKITIIDDDVFEQDEHFYVHLHNPSYPAVLTAPKTATVMILDDDHSGIFGFDEQVHVISESVGTYKLKVRRYSGSRGNVLLPYWTVDGSARDGKDYVARMGELLFEQTDLEQFILIKINDESSYEKNAVFHVKLGKPYISPDDPLIRTITVAENKAPADRTVQENNILMSLPKNGEIAEADLTIIQSEEFRNTVDKLLQKTNASTLIGTSSWKEQFMNAFTVRSGRELYYEEEKTATPVSGEGEEEEEEEDDFPSFYDYFVHFICLFWKVAFSIVPPTSLCNGYISFAIAIAFITVLTSILGDVASHFGCTLGIKDAVTAITLVAAGTSLPDTFASKVCAINDKTADNSIGNVTGSNAVNVYLGIGLAWSMGAIYHNIKGDTFIVKPGCLAFSTTVFLIESMVAIALLMWRRSAVGGELGGPTGARWASFVILTSLWVIYLTLSILQAHDVIKGF